MGAKEYFKPIYTSLATVLEGMVVTLANLFRKPITIQYPDRTERPVKETLPPRYRGLLEVDIQRCTACGLCQQACPIDCILLVVEKRDKVRGMTEFAIDIGKCMFCGLCCEPCPTQAIRMTPEFEGAVYDEDHLVLRFVPEGQFVVPPKAKEALSRPTPPRGEIARRALERAKRENEALRARLKRELGITKSGGEEGEEAAAGG